MCWNNTESIFNRSRTCVLKLIVVIIKGHYFIFFSACPKQTGNLTMMENGPAATWYSRRYRLRKETGYLRITQTGMSCTIQTKNETAVRHLFEIGFFRLVNTKYFAMNARYRLRCITSVNVFSHSYGVSNTHLCWNKEVMRLLTGKVFESHKTLL